MDLDVNQYMSIFVEEAREHLQLMTDVLMELEKNPEDVSQVNEIFRVAHTIKGMAGTMGFQNMANLTHDMENVLSEVRSGNMVLTGDIVDLLFECFDALDAQVNEVVESGSEGTDTHQDIIDKLNALLSGKPQEKAIKPKESVVEEPSVKSAVPVDDVLMAVLQKAKEQDMNVFSIRVVLDEKCVLKSARAFVTFSTLEDHGEIVRSVPSSQDIENEQFDREFALCLVTESDIEVIKHIMETISELELYEVSDIMGILDEAEKKHQEQEEVKDNAHSPKDAKAAPPVAEVKADNKSAAKKGVAQKSVRVDIERLDSLMNLVSELIIIKTRMDDLSGYESMEGLTETIEYLERITTSLNEAVMKVRMVPVERVFNRFPRLVRDLSKELGKEVDLEMSGEETEVDRTVIDEIGDPLLHMIRNSLDHGIETPEDRIKKGKPEKGMLVLRAYPDGNNVVIEVGDDGGGIDEERVARKAVEKGLLSQQELDMMSKEDKVALLFQAGFSTAEKITDVSGRGVGLDVVKSKIEAINGVVEVETEKDKGSKFIIRLPLTLAIIHALLIKLEEEIYAIPLSSISEIITIHSTSIRDVQGQDVVLFRGKTLPIVKLKNLLGMYEDDDGERELTVVVIRKGAKQAGVVVDNLIGQQEIVIKNLGNYLGTVKYLSGATILGDGSISLIIDTNLLI